MEALVASLDAKSLPSFKQFARSNPPGGGDVRPLPSLRLVEDLLFERCIDICHETVRRLFEEIRVRDGIRT